MKTTCVRLSARPSPKSLVPFVVAVAVAFVVVVVASASAAAAAAHERTCPEACACPDETAADCASASLTAVPAGLPATLRKLNLSSNALTTIDEHAFASLPDLSVLVVSYSRVSAVAGAALRDLRSLQVFYCSNNDLVALDPTLFRATESIERVVFFKNRLRAIDAGLFRDLRSLQHVDLSYNEIERVHADSFGNNPNLALVALNNNRLARLAIIPHVPKLQILTLANNRLVCDCGLIPLWDWIRARGVDAKAATCGRPPAAAGRRVSGVSATDLHCWSSFTGATTRLADGRLDGPADAACPAGAAPASDADGGCPLRGSGRVRRRGSADRTPAAGCEQIVCGVDDVTYYLRVNATRRRAAPSDEDGDPSPGTATIVATVCGVAALVSISACAALHVVKRRNRNDRSTDNNDYETVDSVDRRPDRRSAAEWAIASTTETVPNGEYEVNSIYGLNID